MVALNVTAVGAAANGYLTVYSCDEDPPATSNVNYVADQAIPNLVLSRISADGYVCVETSAVTDIVVDIVGYVPAGSSVTPLPQPGSHHRLARPRRNPSNTGWPALRDFYSCRRTLRLWCPCQCSARAPQHHGDGLTQPGFVTVYPCSTKPETSSLNYAPGRAIANLVVSRLSANGQVCIYRNTGAHVIVDVAGYATNGITTLPQPVRITDTRATSDAKPPANGTLTLDIGARADIPDDATAAVYNLTAARAIAPGYATSYPCDTTRPTASNLNYRPGTATATAAITKLSATGQLCIYNKTATDLIVDLIGYTQGTTDYVPITPTRILDTREGWQPSCGWIAARGRPAAGSAPTMQSTAYNLVSGEHFEVLLPEGEYIWPTDTLFPVIDAGCTAVLHYGFGVLHRFGFDGSRSHTTVPVYREPGDVPGWAGIGALQSFEDGTVVHLSDNLTDLQTGLVIGPGVPPSLTFGQEVFGRRDEALSRNGDLMAALYADGSATRHLVRTFSRDGTTIATFEVGPAAMYLSISPDGTYVSVDSRPAVDAAAYGVTQLLGLSRIYTVFGHTVDLAYGYEVAPNSWFTGNGTLLACVQSGQRSTLFSWPLFGNLEILDAPSDHLTNINAACKTFAG